MSDQLQYKSIPGAGNSCVPLDRSIMVELNNKQVTKAEIDEFLLWIGLKSIRTEFPGYIPLNSKGEEIWGQADMLLNKVILYRPSVWIFLHELGHLRMPLDTWHGKYFGDTVKDTYDWWLEYKKTRTLDK